MSTVNGILTDRRSDAKRMRASNSTHGDVEWSCAHVIWRYLGVDVALADDGTEDAMVDVEIDDTNGSRAVCEIVTDTDPHRAAAYERFRDCNFRVPTDQLRMAWQAELSTRCDFRKLNPVSYTHLTLPTIYSV